MNMQDNYTPIQQKKSSKKYCKRRLRQLLNEMLPGVA